MFFGFEPPPDSEEFALDDEGLEKLAKPLDEAVDSGELGPDSAPAAPVIICPWSIDHDPQGDR